MTKGICPQCGVAQLKRRDRTYCGYRCSALAREAAKRGGPRPTKACERCGIEYERRCGWNDAHWAARRFCSIECRGNGRPKTTLTCPQCGAAFVTGRKSRDVYCSHGCYSDHLREIVYPLRTRGSELFSAPMKRVMLERAEGKCEECGSEEDLEFDHVIPRHRGGKGTLENGQVLCSECHKRKTLRERPKGKNRLP